MLKLNRTTEYGLIALSYIRNRSDSGTSSAREISEHFKLPFEILAKTLQRMKERGLIASSYGTRGGYVLSRDLVSLSLAEFLNLMEGPVAVVACATTESARFNKNTTLDSAQRSNESCEFSGQCNISGIMRELNSRMYDFMNRISVEELTRKSYQETEMPLHPVTTQLNIPVPVAFGEEP